MGCTQEVILLLVHTNELHEIQFNTCLNYSFIQQSGQFSDGHNLFNQSNGHIFGPSY